MPVHLRMRDFIPPGGWFHLARSTFTPAIARPPHDHDFAEAFWVERGRGLHLINNQRIRLTPGDLVLIRPADTHAFRATNRAGFTFLNLAFDERVLHQLRRRYFAAADWPWRSGSLPATFHLPAARLAPITAAAEQLAMNRQNRLDLDWMLLSLLRAIQPADLQPTDLPPWLAAAAQHLTDPAILIGGPSALADLTGKSIEHLSRVVRQRFGKTTTEWINDHRLDHAARLLRMSRRPIIDIAADAGFPNLGHFYKQFAHRHHTTPRRYRLASQAM